MPAIKNFVKKRGAQLAGVADLSLLKGIKTHPADLLAPYRYAISIGLALESYGRYDNKTEERAYTQLGTIARSVEKFIKSNRHNTLTVPPDERLGDKPPGHWRGAVSHKAIARAAGLGWIGKSSLLVTPQFGPRVGLISILTDMVLEPDAPLANLCPGCSACIDACPIGAINDASFTDYPQKIDRVLNVEKCGLWIDETWERGTMCYDCMTQCTFGES